MANTGGGRWISQSRCGGSYNSNPNLSNCPHSSHYTADLIQTFVVVGVKAKFRTAPRPRNDCDCCLRGRARGFASVCVPLRLEICTRTDSSSLPQYDTFTRRDSGWEFTRENRDREKITLRKLSILWAHQMSIMGCVLCDMWKRKCSFKSKLTSDYKTNQWWVQQKYKNKHKIVLINDSNKFCRDVR